MSSAIRINTRGFVILCACTLFTTATRAADWDVAPLEDMINHVFNRQSSWIELVSYQCAPDVGCADSCVPGGPCRSLSSSGCCDSFCTRPTLTNGFGGLQPALAGHGITYDAKLTQFGQRVTTGGAHVDNAYGGKLDQFLILDSKHMGLWEGAQMIMHAETRFGDDVILDAAGLAPVNANLLYPTLNNNTAITGLLFQQAADSLGAGWFYSGLSSDFKNLVNPLVPLRDLWGVELYYNAAVTPWFHLTGDLQVVRPGIQANDTAVVLGLRGWIHL